MAALTVLVWQACCASGNCISFQLCSKHPYCFDEVFIAPGVPAAVAESKSHWVRSRYKGCSESEYTPGGKYQYSTKDGTDGQWSDWHETDFGENSPDVTVEWTDTPKSSGHKIRYNFPTAAAPWQDIAVNYTATFSTKNRHMGRDLVGGDLSAVGYHDEGATVQVWHLWKDSPPAHPINGQKAAFPKTGGGDVNAEVKQYENTTRTWNSMSPVANLVSNDNRY